MNQKDSTLLLRERIYDCSVHLSNPDGFSAISGTIGVRYARGCSPGDLWTKYFTSSKYVQEFREDHGEPDVVEVRREFLSQIDAREWEHKVLRRLGVIGKIRWLNKSTGKAIPPQIGLENPMAGLGKAHPRIGQKHSDETKKKIKRGLKGKNTGKQSVDRIMNRSVKNTGKRRSAEQRNRISNAMKGISKSKEHRQILSDIRQGTIRCYDLEEHTNVTISKEEYYSNPVKYHSHNSPVVKEDKKIKT